MNLDETMVNAMTADCEMAGGAKKLFPQMLQDVINRSLAAEMQTHAGNDLVMGCNDPTLSP